MYANYIPSLFINDKLNLRNIYGVKAPVMIRNTILKSFTCFHKQLKLLGWLILDNFLAEIKHNNIFIKTVKKRIILPYTDKKNKMSTDCLLYVLMLSTFIFKSPFEPFLLHFVSRNYQKHVFKFYYPNTVLAVNALRQLQRGLTIQFRVFASLLASVCMQ